MIQVFLRALIFLSVAHLVGCSRSEGDKGLSDYQAFERKGGDSSTGGGDISPLSAHEIESFVKKLHQQFKENEEIVHEVLFLPLFTNLSNLNFQAREPGPSGKFQQEYRVKNQLLEKIVPPPLQMERSLPELNQSVEKKVGLFLPRFKRTQLVFASCEVIHDLYSGNDKRDKAASYKMNGDGTFEICFDLSKLTSLGRRTGYEIILGLYAHEIGHILGLGEQDAAILGETVENHFVRSSLNRSERSSLISTYYEIKKIHEMTSLDLDAYFCFDPQTPGSDNLLAPTSLNFLRRQLLAIKILRLQLVQLSYNFPMSLLRDEQSQFQENYKSRTGHLQALLHANEFINLHRELSAMAFGNFDISTCSQLVKKSEADQLFIKNYLEELLEIQP